MQVFGEEKKMKYDELKEAFMNTGPRKKYCKKRIDQKGTRHDFISILKRSDQNVYDYLPQGWLKSSGKEFARRASLYGI